MGRAAKLAALKLRVSRAGAPYVKASGLRQAPDTPREISGKFELPPEALGGSGKLPAGFGKPCKAPGRLINQEPHEKRCKEPYKVTPSAKPTFREVRGHKIHSDQPSSVPGTATELPSSQWLFYQRKAACASFPRTARALLVLPQLPKLPRSSGKPKKIREALGAGAEQEELLQLPAQSLRLRGRSGARCFFLDKMPLWAGKWELGQNKKQFRDRNGHKAGFC